MAYTSAAPCHHCTRALDWLSLQIGGANHPHTPVEPQNPSWELPITLHMSPLPSPPSITRHG